MRIVPVVLCAASLLGAPSSAQDADEAERPPRLTSEQLRADYADWRALEPGLELRALPAPQASRFADELIVVLRIDPERFAFVMLAAAAEDGVRRSAADWAARDGLVAATNAGMFEAARAGRPVGFARADGADVNPSVNADNTVFAFGPNEDGAPDARLIDRECDDFGALQHVYDNLLQSIRMISCDGRNVWTQQPRQWSTAALGVDSEGRVLFIHVRSPYSVHDLITMLQAAPLDLQRAMYLEGGPESTLFAETDEVRLERLGSFETLFYESDDNVMAWPLPNVIGVRRRAEQDATAGE